MPSFDMNTCPEKFVPLIYCVINDTLYQVMPDLRQSLLQFVDVMNLARVTNVSVHAFMPKEDILAFNVTQKYTNKFIWLIVSTIRQNGKIVLDTPEFCYFGCYVFHKVLGGSVATHCRCGGNMI